MIANGGQIGSSFNNDIRIGHQLAVQAYLAAVIL